MAHFVYIDSPCNYMSRNVLSLEQPLDRAFILGFGGIAGRGVLHVVFKHVNY